MLTENNVFELLHSHVLRTKERCVFFFFWGGGGGGGGVAYDTFENITSRLLKTELIKWAQNKCC